MQLRDHKQCFKAACLVLHRAMRDKVLPVLLASHELFKEAFTQAKSTLPESELREAMEALLPNALAKLGDSNIRLHDSCKEVMNFCAEQSFFGLSAVLQRLRGIMATATASRGHSRAKQLGGIVDAVNGLVEHFPGRRADDDEDDVQMWTQDDIAPFIAAGLDDVVGPRTRTNAAKLAVTVYSTLGREALNPLLATLRPAVKNLLLQKFQEAEQDAADDEDGEDMPEPSGPLLDARTALNENDTMGLVISGSACHIAPSHGSASHRMATPHTSRSGGQISHISELSGVSAPEGQKWTSDLSEQEEYFMDEILEDAGLVFGKDDKVAVAMEDEIIGLGIGASLDGRSPIECY